MEPHVSASEPIRIENAVLGADVRRHAIDDAIRHSFEGVSGAWSVTVVEDTSVSPPRMRVTVHGGDSRFDLWLRAFEQDPDLLRHRDPQGPKARKHSIPDREVPGGRPTRADAGTLVENVPRVVAQREKSGGGRNRAIPPTSRPTCRTGRARWAMALPCALTASRRNTKRTSFAAMSNG